MGMEAFVIIFVVFFVIIFGASMEMQRGAVEIGRPFTWFHAITGSAIAAVVIAGVLSILGELFHFIFF